MNTFTSSMRSSSMNTSNENDQEGEIQLSKWDSIRRLLHDSFMKLRYPRLYMRKRKLLVPVRFHELRCHFIEQNGLSSKFKVSVSHEVSTLNEFGLTVSCLFSHTKLFSNISSVP